MSTCEQDLEQAAPLLNLPCMQQTYLIAIHALVLCLVEGCSTSIIDRHSCTHSAQSSCVTGWTMLCQLRTMLCTMRSHHTYR